MGCMAQSHRTKAGAEYNLDDFEITQLICMYCRNKNLYTGQEHRCDLAGDAY